MSRQTRSEKEAGQFGRLFRGTVLLALVFSAGLITGQRILSGDGDVAPMVSLSSTRGAVEEPAKPVKMTFSFYEHLSGKDDEEAAAPVHAQDDSRKPMEVVDLPVVEQPKAEAPLKEIGVPRQVIETVQEALEKPDGAEGALYTIQVASHPSRAMATRDLARLRAMGLDAHMIAVESNDGKFYRVRVGKFATLDTVNARLNELNTEGKVQGFVTPF